MELELTYRMGRISVRSTHAVSSITGTRDAPLLFCSLNSEQTLVISPVNLSIRSRIGICGS